MGVWYAKKEIENIKFELMQKGPKLPTAAKRPATSTTHNENASRLANRTIPEEPTREDQETYNNSIERMGQNIGKLMIDW